MIFANPGPIGAACFMAKEVVTSALSAFYQAIIDLTTLGHSINMDFGFCSITIVKKDLRYVYRPGFASDLNVPTFETKLRKSHYPTSDIWTTSYKEKWAQSGLNTILKRPNSPMVRNANEKTLALKILSLDFNTADKTEISRFGGVILPSIAKK
eukprot:TRINITY_DN1282_c0_g1_i13.p1 TRINITY_DN1282_c0_g1~~TRINITY_DN1282_c0_g1_i13.p1  ORF type:complete len:154 (-),score=27.58 TRINITY_DN1282_c0_g1_i13:103-564(-)